MPAENSGLVVVPGHIPQCVEIFKGKKVDMNINIAHCTIILGNLFTETSHMNSLLLNWCGCGYKLSKGNTAHM